MATKRRGGESRPVSHDDTLQREAEAAAAAALGRALAEACGERFHRPIASLSPDDIRRAAVACLAGFICCRAQQAKVQGLTAQEAEEHIFA